MSLDTFELDKKMLDYSISQFRNIPEYVKFCEASVVGLNKIQDVVNYISDIFNLDNATGIWLDYIGWLVGLVREEYIDVSNYFCVNETELEKYFAWTYSSNTIYTLSASPNVDDNVYSDTNNTLFGTISSVSSNTITVSSVNYTRNSSNDTFVGRGDVNREVFFYFPNSVNTEKKSTLPDDLYRNQIKAKIAYNISNGTREELIFIIKHLVNADSVIIYKHSPMLLDIRLYGESIYTVNIADKITNVLPNGVGLYNNDVSIYDYIPYQDIERLINNIIEETEISGDYEGYDYIDIDNDLDDILEI